MSLDTAIEWTDHTWNPWHGCHKISPGCKFCYMFRDKARYGQDPNVVVRSKTKFADPLKWPKIPAMCFTCSWSDWLIEEADEWRDEAYDIIRRTPWITYQILTKRIDRARGRVPDPPLPNIWWGVSAENQKYADERIPILLETPAAIRFVSYEPALGPLSLKWKWVSKGHPFSGGPMVNLLRPWEEPKEIPALDWIIAGGESGGMDARPAHPDWFRRVRDQSESAGVAFFFKQWGEHSPVGSVRAPVLSVCADDGWSGPCSTEALDKHMRESHSGIISCPPFQLMYRVGKTAAGALLDGREWREFPKPAHVDAASHSSALEATADEPTGTDDDNLPRSFVDAARAHLEATAEKP